MLLLRHRNLIQALVRGREEEIAAQSLINCHAEGVDSILFDDTPGSRIRMFIAHHDHTLWRNDIEFVRSGQPMSVGFHPHHCDVELEVVHGHVRNIYALPSVRYPSRESTLLTTYRYQSQITTGSSRFVKESETHWVFCHFDMSIRGLVSLPAAELHTIVVPFNQQAAWFVWEGADDPCYQPLCHTTADLTHFDSLGLYKPMSVNYLCTLLSKLS